MNPDQTAPRGPLSSGSTMFASDLESQADDKAEDICCDWQLTG